MKFSISTTFYKRSHLVDRVYQDIKSQTYTHWEWIVTDDFSEENSAKEKLLEIASQDNRVKYYEQSRKKEIFWNPQTGATGDVIVQFDSDDIHYPTILENYHYFLNKYPEVVLISSSSQEINEQGGLLCAHQPYIWLVDEIIKKNILGYKRDLRCFRNIFRNFDDGELKFYKNDWNIVGQVIWKGKLLHLPKVLGKYVVSQHSISHQPNPTQWILEEDEVINRKFPDLSDNSKCYEIPHFWPVWDASRSLAFLVPGATTKTKVLFVDNSLFSYQKELIRELYLDFEIDFTHIIDKYYNNVVFFIDGSEEFPNTEIFDYFIGTKLTNQISIYQITNEKVSNFDVENFLYSKGVYFSWSFGAGEKYFNIYF
jgi:teichuronic acid biosynthesis glycosyltransferase TuaG